MNKIFVILVLILSTYCQIWHSEVNGYNKGEPNNGYSGIYGLYMNDFYLCSERKYRVHYEKDEKTTWSQEFTACQTAGIGRHIDGIAISGGLKYRGRTEGSNWLGEITGYNTTDFWFGHCGTLKSPLCSILIDGGEYYRSAHNLSAESSYEKIVAENVIYNLFKLKKIFNFDKEIEIYKDSTLNIGVILLNTSKINFDGDLIFQVENKKLIDSNYNRLISNKLKKHINEVIDFDFDKVKNYTEINFFNNGLPNGTVSINFKWPQNLIEIHVGSKIQAIHYSYRGGFRISIHINDAKLLLPKIKKTLIVLYKYTGRKIPEELFSEFNTFEQIEDIINDLDMDSIIAEEIIFYTILSSVLPYDDEFK